MSRRRFLSRAAIVLVVSAIFAIALLDLDPWLLSAAIAVSMFENLIRHPEAFRQRLDIGLILKMLFVSVATPLVWYGIIEIVEQMVLTY